MNQVTMELKGGLKKTEVGIIPVDWNVRSLKNLAVQITDGDHLTPKRTQDGYYLLSARNVRDGFLDFRDVDYVGDDEFIRMRRRCAPENGDILISCSGHGLGRVALVPKGLKCVLVRSAALVKIDHRSCNSDFVHYWLRSSNAQKQISVQLSRAAQPNLFINNIEQLLAPIPPSKAEQDAIATALRDADAVMESLEQFIEKKRLIKQGAMQELFTGRRRLPGFEGTWRVQRLGELGEFLKGSGVTRSQASSGNLPCVRYGELYTKFHDLIRVFHSWISPEVARSATPIEYGDILFAGSGETKEDIGKCAAVLHSGKAYAGGDIVILRPRRIDPAFLGYYLNTTHFSRQKASRGQGDAVVHIGATSLAAIEGRFPEMPEQAAIASVLFDMDAEIAALEEKLAKTRRIKQGMMQELLTGRIRLL